MPNEEQEVGGIVDPPSYQEEVEPGVVQPIPSLSQDEVTEFLESSGYEFDDPLAPGSYSVNGLTINLDTPENDPGLVPNEPVYLKRVLKIENGKITQVAYVYMQAYALSTSGYSYHFIAPDYNSNTFVPVTVTFE